MLQNFILFQVGWFSCVLGGAAQGYAWIGVAMVIVIVAIHLLRASNLRSEVILILATSFLGTVWDSILILAGLFEFSNGIFIIGIAPYWLISMWALFATTLNVSMKWMKDNYLLAVLFGAIGGPLAYYAGHRLGAVGFNDSLVTLSAVAVGWAVIMPLLIALAKRFNGYEHLQLNSQRVKTV